ncbi:MAG: hypothetical protein UT54_C0005G0005 [Candidatus Daviesbacteria bacterium GW2011_GWB1_39_5]|nr:MAG: hypothetical protein UT54_C0005G0005 [Candidatus Daviesbacteria bacterium GW2011_GWB1_39_5]
MQFFPYDGDGAADGEPINPVVVANQRHLFEYFSRRRGITCQIRKGANKLPHLLIRKS